MNCSWKSFSCWIKRRSLHAHTVCINYHRYYYFFHVPLCSGHKLNLVHHVNSSWSNFFSVAVALAKTFVVYNARRRRFFFVLSISKVKSFQFSCISSSFSRNFCCCQLENVSDFFLLLLLIKMSFCGFGVKNSSRRRFSLQLINAKYIWSTNRSLNVSKTFFKFKKLRVLIFLSFHIFLRLILRLIV